MLAQLALGSAVITLTVVVFVGFMVSAMVALERGKRWLGRRPGPVKSLVTLIAVTHWTLAGLSAAVWIWAMVFLTVGEFDALEPSAYFALVVFTTLGFGDIIQDRPWRLLSGLCAANGLLLFGLGTAFLVEFLRRAFDPRRR